MISHTNKLVLFAVALAMMVILSVTGRGQSAGFVLTGRLDFAGFRAGDPSWMIGKGIILQPIDPALTSRLRELEGKKIQITVRQLD